MFKFKKGEIKAIAFIVTQSFPIPNRPLGRIGNRLDAKTIYRQTKKAMRCSQRWLLIYVNDCCQQWGLRFNYRLMLNPKSPVLTVIPRLL